MQVRLNELNEQRKAEKDQLVQQALDRKFKMETDDLRREETHFMMAGTQLEREKQLMDKRQKMEENIIGMTLMHGQEALYLQEVGI